MWTVLFIVWGALLAGWMFRSIVAFIARAVRRRMLADDMSDVAAQVEGHRRWGKRFASAKLGDVERLVGITDVRTGVQIHWLGRGPTWRAAFADADRNAKRAVDEVLK